MICNVQLLHIIFTLGYYCTENLAINCFDVFSFSLLIKQRYCGFWEWNFLKNIRPEFSVVGLLLYDISMEIV